MSVYFKLLPGNGAVGVGAAVVGSCGMNGGAQTDHGDPDFYAPNHPLYVVCIPGLSDSYSCVTVLVCSQQMDSSIVATTVPSITHI